MALDTRIPMSYQGIELDNPANAMALAERAGEAKNRNALSKIELEEAQKGPNPRDQFVNETKQIGDFIKAQLPMLDETSADDFFNALNEQGGAAGKMAAESWFKNPAPAGEKLKGLTGRLNPVKQGAAAFSGSTITGPDGQEYVLNKQTGQMMPTGMSRGLKPTEQMNYQEELARSKAAGGAAGKMQGENVDAMGELDARLPALYEISDKLGALGQVATYTTAGKLRDATQRQLGMDAGEGAVARAEYISTVDNEVLPLLRSTFGAAFTAAEGDRLRATLGNEDLSPPEKDAALRSFIDSKEREVRQLGQRYGLEPQNIRPKAGAGKPLTMLQIQQAAAKSFGGDVNAAYQDAVNRGYSVVGQ